jgi:hypothetical protein
LQAGSHKYSSPAGPDRKQLQRDLNTLAALVTTGDYALALAAWAVSTIAITWGLHELASTEWIAASVAGILLGAVLDLNLIFWVLEGKYKAVQLPTKDLDSSGNRFDVIDNVEVHCKSSGTLAVSPAGTGKCTYGLALLHGFGANLWSWRQVQERLVGVLSADGDACMVTSHDQPGLGVTSRYALSAVVAWVS